MFIKIIIIMIVLIIVYNLYNRMMYENFFIQETKPYWKNIGAKVFPVQEGFSNRPTNECYMNCPYPNPYGHPCYNSRCCVKGGGNTVML